METATTLEQTAVATGEDFNCTISADLTPHEAAEKIGRVSEWWAKQTEGESQKTDDVFTVRFGSTFVTFKITEASDRKIVWHVIDSHIPSLQDTSEWTGTDVIFKLSTDCKRTELDFTHRGLLPDVECYDMCTRGWTQYVPGSLLNFFQGGKGNPA